MNDKDQGSRDQANAPGTPAVANATGGANVPGEGGKAAGEFDAASGGALERASGRVIGQGSRAGEAAGGGSENP